MTPAKKCVRFVRHLPMGVSQSPDISQEIMEDLFRNFNEVDIYMDDIGVFSKDWNRDCMSISSILNVLKTNGFTVNPAKCEWAVQETDWLGYWLTPNGLKPWKKKISAILVLKRPETVKQLRSFIAITYSCTANSPSQRQRSCQVDK
jgi:Reverse transcriptase (RNA-dependent DNA polymerase)